jgi:hypothetical protein
MKICFVCNKEFEEKSYNALCCSGDCKKIRRKFVRENNKQPCIYKIYCKDENVKETYIGSTSTYEKRKQRHIFNCKNDKSKNYNIFLYQFIRQNGGWDNFEMKLIEKLDKNISKKELLEKEKYHIKLNECKLNKINPITTKEERKQQQKQYKEQQKEWYEQNKDKIKQQQKEWYEKNKDKIKQYNGQNKDKIKQQQKEWYEKNKDKIKQYNGQNKDKIKQQQKEWYEQNKDKIKQKQKQYYEQNKNKYKCEVCNFNAYSKNDYTRHCSSQKHKNRL